ncbi:MAG: MazG nucleotide pyrophosphohydrolase domain-containing protein, partial [Croceimicrobium sp.]
AGFDWEETAQVWDKLREEIKELEVEVEANDQEKVEAEFGDVLFSLINISRFIKVDPESALERTNKKFINRFQYLEEATKAAGLKLEDMSLVEMDQFWEEAKAKGL